jgi:non-ribosomal peptide synthetase component F
VVPEEVRADGAALLAFVRARKLDVFDCTPSLLRVLLGEGLLDGGPTPEAFLTAGEAIDEAMWDVLRRAERTAFYNIYGPTECTVDATWHRVGSQPGGPTIGRPLAGYEVFLLDPGLRPVPAGAPGELCVGGAQGSLHLACRGETLFLAKFQSLEDRVRDRW